MAEGFDPLREHDSPFQVVLSIEKDSNACRTLWVRTASRLLAASDELNAYRAAVVSADPEKHIRAHYPTEACRADSIVWRTELGNPEVCPDQQLHERIRIAVNNDERWILIGGPPCQAFSRAGKARRNGDPSYRLQDDPRVHLYREYLKVLHTHRPAAFVLENVPDMLRTKLGDCPFTPALLEGLMGNGSVRWRLFSCSGVEVTSDSPAESMIVQAETFGIPQARRRLILVGIREDVVGGLPALHPVQELTPSGAVLNGLPHLRSGISRGRDNDDAWRRVISAALTSSWLAEAQAKHGKQLIEIIQDAVVRATSSCLERGSNLIKDEQATVSWNEAWYGSRQWDLVLNHHSKEHMPEDLHRYLFTASLGAAFARSPRLIDFPDGLQPRHRNAQSGKFTDRFRVQLACRPATTVTSHLSQDGHYFIHPDPAQCRSLTVREAARLQTFPDDYLFLGNKVSQYIQVGNAVPPLLARMVAQAIARAISV